MGKRKKLALLGVTAAMLFLVGCSDKAQSIKALEKQVESLTAENSDLRAVNAGMSVTETLLESSLQAIEGSVVPEFLTIDNQIVFPNKLNLPESKDDVNNSKIQVGSMFTFIPSNNWMTKVEGSTLHFTHSSKIWGKIKAVNFDYKAPEEAQFRSILQSFFKNFPATNVTYRKAYMGTWQSGLIAKAEITVDKKPHVINIGFAISGKHAVLFMFDFEDNKTGVQQELIDLLISSGTDGASSIKLE